MMLVAALPAWLVVFIVAFVPESERWRKAVQTIAANPLRDVFSGRLRASTLLAILFASVALIGTWGSVQWLPLWANKMVSESGTAELRREFPNYYSGADLDASLLEQRRGAEAAIQKRASDATANIQMIQGLGAIVGTLLAPLIGARFGRRTAYFLLCLSSWIVCDTAFRTVTQYSNTFLLWAFFMSLTTASFYGWFPLYFPELFPTRVRATGQGVAFFYFRRCWNV